MLFSILFASGFVAVVSGEQFDIGLQNSPNGRIINGSETEPAHQFEFIVSLRIYKKHVCSGVILTERFLLTAAHCIWWYLPETFTTGSLLSKPHGEYDVEWGSMHPNFISNKPLHDIAVLKSKQKIVFSRVLIDSVAPATLPTSNIGPHVPIAFAGWGLKEGGVGTDNLLYYRGNVADTDECKKIHADKIVVGDNDLCALATENQGLCIADAGGPLVDGLENILHGIASRAEACATGKPDVFTAVYPYLLWIREEMSG